MHLRTFAHRHAELILNANHRMKKEIESVLEQLELHSPAGPASRQADSPHRQIQRAFLRRHWQTEALVSRRSAKRHYFDAFKERIALEIELSSRERLYRDYLRFQMAEMDGHIDVGVIVLLGHDVRYVHPCGARNGIPRLEDVADDLRALHAAITVPIWVVALE
jgi:hypothetical protein